MPLEAPLHRLSLDDVARMADAGILRDEDRVELIDGVLVDVVRPPPEHSGALAFLNKHFVGSLGDREVRIQDPLLIAGGFLMPDLLVVDPVPRDRHPETAALIVEIAVTTQRHDSWKASRYARAGVDEYWLVDLVGRTLTAYRDPRGDVYARVSRFEPGERIEALVGGGEIDISELLGPAPA